MSKSHKIVDQTVINDPKMGDYTTTTYAIPTISKASESVPLLVRAAKNSFADKIGKRGQKIAYAEHVNPERFNRSIKFMPGSAYFQGPDLIAATHNELYPEKPFKVFPCTLDGLGFTNKVSPDQTAKFFPGAKALGVVVAIFTSDDKCILGLRGPNSYIKKPGTQEFENITEEEAKKLDSDKYFKDQDNIYWKLIPNIQKQFPGGYLQLNEERVAIDQQSKLLQGKNAASTLMAKIKETALQECEEEVLGDIRKYIETGPIISGYSLRSGGVYDKYKNSQDKDKKVVLMGDVICIMKLNITSDELKSKREANLPQDAKELPDMKFVDFVELEKIGNSKTHEDRTFVDAHHRIAALCSELHKDNSLFAERASLFQEAPAQSRTI